MLEVIILSNLTLSIDQTNGRVVARQWQLKSGCWSCVR